MHTITIMWYNGGMGWDQPRRGFLSDAQCAALEYLAEQGGTARSGHRPLGRTTAMALKRQGMVSITGYQVTLTAYGCRQYPPQPQPAGEITPALNTSLEPQPAGETTPAPNTSSSGVRMSRSGVFGSEDKYAPEELLPRQMSSATNYVTPIGLQLLQATEIALANQRERLMLAGHDPVQSDDIRYVDRDLVYVRARLKSAIVVQPELSPTGQVAFGAHVTVLEEGTDSPYTWVIVGEDEADPDQGKVSYTSPLARALQGAQVGQTVQWDRPVGAAQLTVQAIAYT